MAGTGIILRMRKISLDKTNHSASWLFVAAALSLLLLPPVAGIATAQSPEREENLKHLHKIQKTDEVDRAVASALAYLAQQQDKETGAFPGKHQITTTSLACMALMAAGEQDGRTRYGAHLRDGIRFLVRQSVEKSPYLGRDGGRMYGHAIATVTLCEAYGMMAEPRDNRAVRNAIQKALPIILQAQVGGDSRHRGGWRYNPSSADADLSVTAWQILALRAIRNCGFEVPEETISNALGYVRRAYNQDKGFAYMPGRPPTPAMLAAGIVCMETLGANNASDDIRKIETSAQAMKQADLEGGKHFYYQSYYVATAANMLGDEYRTALLPKLQEVLLGLQQEDAQFAKHTGYEGGTYSTAVAALTLAIRYQYLPIYQD